MKNTKHYMLYYKDKVYPSKNIIYMINIYKKEEWGKDLFKSYFDLDNLK